MKLCILSDSHDNIPYLCAAIEAAKEQGADAVLHCGDVVAPSTLGKAQRIGLPIHAIHGNNSGDLYALSQLSGRADSLVHYYGQDAAFTLADWRIFLVHYPHYAKAMAVTGDYDLVCCGHSHRTEISHIKNIHGSETLLINPGTIGGVGAKATYVMADLAARTFDILELAKQDAPVLPA
jgi:putative phosphoesterase